MRLVSTPVIFGMVYRNYDVIGGLEMGAFNANVELFLAAGLKGALSVSDTK